jgi:hypothetical protein
MSGSKRRDRAPSAQGQEADIAVLAINPDFTVYGNHFFSVHPVRSGPGGAFSSLI